jgi:hypothetical protein
LDVNTIDDKTISGLGEVCKKHQGSKIIDVVLYDEADEIKLNTHSKSKQVEITAALLTDLQQLDLSYKLN